MTSIFLIVLGVAVGFLLGWLLAAAKTRSPLQARLRDAEARVGAAESLQAELREQIRGRDLALEQVRDQLRSAELKHATAEAKLESTQANLAEQKQLLDDAASKLSDAFSALSAAALSQNNTSFLQLATERLGALQQEAKGDLMQRQQAIQALVNPLADALKRHHEGIDQMESERQRAFGTIEQHLKTLGEASQKLESETTSLVTALTKPGVKGRWGEITLKRVVEAAGMSAHCDFVEQPTADTPDGRRRPDLIVKLPEGRSIVIDAKFPLKAYLDAMEAADETRRRELMSQHAAAVRSAMKELGSKSYWSQFDEAPNFVVLFLPMESSFGAAVELDRELVADGIANKVVLATPTTLIACLLIVAYGWQQQKMAENSRAIAEIGSDLYDRLLKFTDHLGNIRNTLQRHCDSVNDAIGSFDSRLVPGARKLRELGAGQDSAEIETPQAIEAPIRAPQTKSAGAAE
jgi:DNA recombination protein RmuC